MGWGRGPRLACTSCNTRYLTKEEVKACEATHRYRPPVEGPLLHWARVAAQFNLEHYGWAGPKTRALWTLLRHQVTKRDETGIKRVMQLIRRDCPWVFKKDWARAYLPYALEALERACHE